MIERRLENLLALDYPADRLEIVVASDASTDRTDELVEGVAAREPRVRLLAARAAARSRRRTGPSARRTGEVVAFSDANATWAPDALRRLVAALADPEVAYVCGRLRLEAPTARTARAPTGATSSGSASRSRGSARSPAATARSTRCAEGTTSRSIRASGHDLAFPYLMVQRGRRAVYEPRALAFEKPTPSNEAEYRRKVRMFEHCWLITLRGSMLRRLPPGYLVEVVSHRLLRYGSGRAAPRSCSASLALVAAGAALRCSCSRRQLALAGAPRRRRPVARYYVLVTGRPCRRSPTTCAAACPPPGRPRRGRR